MLSSETSIKILIALLGVGGVYFFVMAALSIPVYGDFLIAGSFVAAGLISIFLFSGFIKREKWTWYTTIVISIISFLFPLILFAITKITATELVIYFIVLLIWITLLFRCAKLFLSKPKESIKKWFSNIGFLTVMISYLIITIFGSSILIYSYWYRPHQLSKELQLATQIFDTEQIEKETENWESYKGEQIGISLKYPKSQEGLSLGADEIPRIMESFCIPDSRISFYNSRFTSLDFRGIFPSFFEIDISKGRPKLIKNLSDLTLEELIALREDDIKKKQEQYKKEETIIGNMPATKLSYIGSTHYKYTSEIYLLRNNDIYLIKIEFSTDAQNKYSLLADKILATIKFIEINKNYCEKDRDCSCGINIDTKECSCENVDYIIFPDDLNKLREQCPDFYNSRGVYQSAVCIKNECKIK